MKKITMLLTIGAIFLLIGGIGAVNAQTNENSNTWYGPMYNWMADHMREYGYSPGACWGGYESGYGGSYGYSDTTQEYAVPTVDDAYDIAKKEISTDASEENIYQVGRWWVVYYTDDDDTIKQGRIDAFTGEVITDTSTYSGTYYQSGTYGPGYRGGMSRGMMYGY